MAAAKCKSLRILKMGICVNVLDEGLCHIASNCLNLRELDMYRCDLIINNITTQDLGFCHIMVKVMIAIYSLLGLRESAIEALLQFVSDAKN